MMGGYREQSSQLGRYLEDTREQAQLPDKAHLRHPSMPFESHLLVWRGSRLPTMCQ